MKISEIISPVTIVSATDTNGNINRAKSDKITDPRRYFAKNKKLIRHGKIKNV